MSAKISKTFATIISTIARSSWNRQRSSIELRNFVDRMSSRIDDIELDIA